MMYNQRAQTYLIVYRHPLAAYIILRDVEGGEQSRRMCIRV